MIDNILIIERQLLNYFKELKIPINKVNMKLLQKAKEIFEETIQYFPVESIKVYQKIITLVKLKNNILNPEIIEALKFVKKKAGRLPRHQRITPRSSKVRLAFRDALREAENEEEIALVNYNYLVYSPNDCKAYENTN
jgi:hypothetical protein